jgi:hypothetical protein
MTISIDYGNTNVISIPKADLVLVSGTLFDYDTDAFHLELRDLEDDELGQVFPTTHRYVANDTIAGSTDFPKIIILAPYSVEFEDGDYSVRLQGTNNNMFDVDAGIYVKNQVLVIPGNSFGNTVTAIGSGVLPSDVTDIKNAIFDETMADADDFRGNIDDLTTDMDLIKTYMALKPGDYVDIDANSISTALGTFNIEITEPSAGVKRFTRI